MGKSHGEPKTKELAPFVISDSSRGQINEKTLKNWGNYSPYFSTVESPAAIPKTCRITYVHALVRHGARAPTTNEMDQSWGSS